MPHEITGKNTLETGPSTDAPPQSVKLVNEVLEVEKLLDSLRNRIYYGYEKLIGPRPSDKPEEDKPPASGMFARGQDSIQHMREMIDEIYDLITPIM